MSRWGFKSFRSIISFRFELDLFRFVGLRVMHESGTWNFVPPVEFSLWTGASPAISENGRYVRHPSGVRVFSDSAVPDIAPLRCELVGSFLNDV